MQSRNTYPDRPCVYVEGAKALVDKRGSMGARAGRFPGLVMGRPVVVVGGREGGRIHEGFRLGCLGVLPPPFFSTSRGGKRGEAGPGSKRRGIWSALTKKARGCISVQFVWCVSLVT